MDALKEILGLDLPTSTRGMTLASLGMLALALIAIPLVWFFSGTDKFIVLFIGGSVLCVMAIFAGGAIYVNSYQASQLREMLAGDFWAHWNYTDEEVQQFSQHETGGKAYDYPEPGVHEVYIGQSGVYQPGKFCSFADLTDVKLESNNPPQTILFYGTSSSSAPVRVGVPYGREADAQQLVERFKTQLSSAAAS
jgi:hypothetical protein